MMRPNSLAFRLFVTAVAWVLVVLPVAGFIIYSLYRQEVVASFDRRIGVLLTVILTDSIDHGENDPEGYSLHHLSLVTNRKFPRS